VQRKPRYFYQIWNPTGAHFIRLFKREDRLANAGIERRRKKPERAERVKRKGLPDCDSNMAKSTLSAGERVLRLPACFEPGMF